MNRASFVRSSAAAAAGATFLRNVAIGSETTSYSSGMAPLVSTILPTSAHEFPDVEATYIVRRAGSLYDLDANPVFLASLAAFSSISTFASGSQSLFSAELATVGNVRIADLVSQDSSALRASGLSAASAFVDLSASDRRLYLTLWERSAFNTRRRFYGSVRAIIFATFYSMPESWGAIGYVGPLLKRATWR